MLPRQSYLVSGYYWEDWNDDEVPGKTVVVAAASEDEATAEYRKQHDPGDRCSRVVAELQEEA